MKWKAIAGVTVVLFVAVLILTIFVFFGESEGSKTGESEVTVSKTDTVLLRDIKNNYPPTPKEVLKYYSEITTCFYNEELDEDKLAALARRARELYDTELVADKTEEEYLEDLKEDILAFQSQGITVSGYTVSSSTDVFYFEEDEYEFARLYANYRLRQGTEFVYSNEKFLLRKDEQGHWKIFGWDLVEENSETTEVTE